MRDKPRRDAGALWLALAWVALALLPWNGDDSGFFALYWTQTWPSGAGGSAIFQALQGGRLWLLPLLMPAGLALVPLMRPRLGAGGGAWLIWTGLAGLLCLSAMALSIDLRGWTWQLPSDLFGPLPRRNPGLGVGALAYGFGMLMLVCRGAAARGSGGGDFFATGLIGTVIAVVAMFVLYPMLRMGISVVQTPRGVFAPEMLWIRIADPRIWSPGGIVPNTVILGLASAASSTFLALTFALVTERTRFPAQRALRLLSILPIITPPFVVGLAVILLLGRNGAVNHLLEMVFGFEGGRWIYGFQGIWFAQTLSFTPVAYLVLVGVVQGINPALEEAAQTLRAGRMHVFRTITLPLALPGIANAFLIGFIESLSDFGNPLLLGGNYDVLPTSIYFAIVGARADRGVAAVLGMILLALMMLVFMFQRWTLAGKAFTTISGKGQAGEAAPLPGAVRWLCYLTALPWAALTAVIYAMILFGGFVENWGIKNVFTFKHYITAFGIAETPTGLRFMGQAWDSLFTTVGLALVAAPLTAMFGLAVAYLLVRQRFWGRTAFEIAALIAGAVPGTVLGIAYILAFNNPPLEFVQTASIVVVSFIVRNMSPGVRAGVAALAQIDRSLEEASMTLRAGPFTTVRRILLPLLRPAILAGLVYSFVAAMTTVTAVIFLVSPGVMLSTVFIVNLAEAGTYGVAIAYSSVLIVIMLAVVVGIDVLLGERRLRRLPVAAAVASPV